MEMTRQRCMLVLLALLWTLFVLWTGRPEKSSDASATSVQRQAFASPEMSIEQRKAEAKEVVARSQGSHRHGKGFLYFLVGPKEELYQDACFSVRSFRKHTQHQNFTLVTDEFGVSLFRGRTHRWCKGAFDQVINIHDTDFRDEARQIKPLKVRSFQLSPYRVTVFLDPDTMACGDVDELFGLLEYLDLAAAYAPGRDHGGEGPVKAVFPEINTGVLAYRDTEPTRRLFQTWDYVMSNSPNRMDQPAFRVALLEERNVRFHVLPPEFMCRFTANGCGTTVMMQGLDPVQKLPAVPCRIIHSKRIQRDVEPFPSDLNWVA